MESGREARTAPGGRNGHALPFGYDPWAPAAASGLKVVGGLARGEEDDTSHVPTAEEIEFSGLRNALIAVRVVRCGLGRSRLSLRRP